MRACSSTDKNYFIGRFVSGLPNFSKKKNSEKWSIQKEGVQGRQLSDALKVLSEKSLLYYKLNRWLLHNSTCI